jgi:hypothetical protein
MVTKPVLLIWGDRDRAVGLASAKELQQMLPQSHLMVLPGVGHIPFEELPDVCNRAMRDWFGSPVRFEQDSVTHEMAEAYAFRRKPSDRSAPPIAQGAA